VKVPKRLKLPRLRLLGRVAGLPIYLVDGERIRDDIDIDFVNGGNGAVYPGYIPPSEIWIDDAQHAIDRTATALHELIERDLMLRHGMGYESAHDAANGHERALRKDLARRRPTGFDARRLADAYRIYLGEKPSSKRSRLLDRDIIGALLKHRRIGTR
jgi:hypothetical protein